MNKTLVIVYLIAVISIAAPATPVNAAEIDEYMEAGWTAFNRSDIIDAIRWFRKAAEMGHPPAQVQLARMLDYSEDNEEAVDWYSKAAEQGSAEGQFELGMMYAIGEGVDQDDRQAEAWVRKAAEQNHAKAIRYLVESYEEGRIGTAVDHAAAVEWLQRGAEQGDPWATRRLAGAYREGQLGLAADPVRAAALEQKLEAAQ